MAAADDNFLDEAMNQQAVWWKRAGIDDEGLPVFDEAVEINCRWSDGVQMIIDDQGNETRSTAELMVDRDLSAGDFLKQGEIGLYAGTSTPLSVEGAREIIRWEKVPDFDGETYARMAYL